MEINKTKKEVIYDALVKLAVYLNHPQGEERLRMFSDDLEKYDLAEIKAALVRVKELCKFFPSMKEILDAMYLANYKEVDDDAMVGMIAHAVWEHGIYYPVSARKMIGEDAWTVIEMAGGWNYVVNHGLTDAFRAHLRELARSMDKQRKENYMYGTDPKPVQIEIDAGELKPIDWINLLS